MKRTSIVIHLANVAARHPQGYLINVSTSWLHCLGLRLRVPEQNLLSSATPRPKFLAHTEMLVSHSARCLGCRSCPQLSQPRHQTILHYQIPSVSGSAK